MQQILTKHQYFVALSRCGGLLCIFLLVMNRTLADSPPNSSLWEAHGGLVSFAMELKAKSGERGVFNVLTVYIKNTSSAPVFLASGPGIGSPNGFNVFINQSDGTRQPLHDFKTASSQAGAGYVSGSVAIDEIAPGQILSRTLELSNDDIVRMNSHLIQFSFHIADKSSGKQYDISSTPRQLIATP